MTDIENGKQTKSKIPVDTITVRSAVTGERRVKVDFALISKRFFSCFGQIDVTTITQEEWLGILSEIEQLRARLEIDDTGYDGIAARDATIEAQQKVIEQLRKERDLLKLWHLQTKAAIHYPACWDTTAYPTLKDALSEIGCNVCDCVKGKENGVYALILALEYVFDEE